MTTTTPEQWKSWYERNRMTHIANSKRNKTLNMQRNREYVQAFLREHPCVDCGISDIRVLEFDHLRDKVREVSILVRNAVSLEKLQAEIDKCEVRCANCHKIKTIERRKTSLL